jgi:hypothetical protein
MRREQDHGANRPGPLSAGILTVVLSLGLSVRNPAARLLTLTAVGAVAVLLVAYLTLVVGFGVSG